MTLWSFTGARAHRNLAQAWRFVREAMPAGIGVVHGGADGVDTVVDIAALQSGRERRVHLPDYSKHGDKAPLVRNQTIIDDGEDCHAFLWPGSRGTYDAIRKAKASGKRVSFHEPELPERLLVFSARIDYSGCARLDITRGSGQGNLAFAPSQEILDRALAARERADAIRAEATRLASQQLTLGETQDEVRARGLRAESMLAQAEEIEVAAWAHYEPRFIAEQRIRFGMRPGGARWGGLEQEAWTRGVRPAPEAWQRVLSLGFVVLACFCTHETRCHRHLLRSRILPALGAVDGGEIPWRAAA